MPVKTDYYRTLRKWSCIWRKSSACIASCGMLHTVLTILIICCKIYFVFILLFYFSGFTQTTKRFEHQKFPDLIFLSFKQVLLKLLKLCPGIFCNLAISLMKPCPLCPPASPVSSLKSFDFKFVAGFNSNRTLGTLMFISECCRSRPVRVGRLLRFPAAGT